MSAGRFTATLIVHEVPEPPPTTPTRGYVPDGERRISPPRPEPIEVGKVVVRAESLDAVKEKVAAHAALI